MVVAVSSGCATHVTPWSPDRAYHTPAPPAFPVHHAMWTAPVRSTLSDGPECGHPGNTHPSTCGRIGVDHVSPLSRDEATTMSRTSPGKTSRHAAYSVPSVASASDVRQHGHAGRREMGCDEFQLLPPSAEVRNQT